MITNLKEIATSTQITQQEHQEVKHEYCEVCGEVNLVIEGTYETVKECKCEYEKRKKRLIDIQLKRYSTISTFEKGFAENKFDKADTFNDKHKECLKAAWKFAKNINKIKVLKSRCGMALMGNAGTGKTFIESCIANQLQSQGDSVIMFKLTKYIEQIKKDFGQPVSETENKLLELVREVDLVIIDDIGSEQLKDRTGWTMEKVYNLIDTIYESDTAVIFSSNNTIEYLEEHLMFNGSNKIMDRINQMCVFYVFDWESVRKLQKDNAEKLF